MHRRAAVALGATLLLGVILRLVWPSDMEYKGDEMFLFHHATGPDPFPWVGQTSGVGTSNPGMGIWVYSLIAKGLQPDSPVQLVRGVMVLNVIALVALAVFALKVVPPRQREPWLWGTALIAVSPLAVMFSRKLWIQSALPPFVIAMLFAWWRRGSRAGALAWGVLGAWLGQIHMTGFFFAGAFAFGAFFCGVFDLVALVSVVFVSVTLFSVAFAFGAFFTGVFVSVALVSVVFVPVTFFAGVFFSTFFSGVTG